MPDLRNKGCIRRRRCRQCGSCPQRCSDRSNVVDFATPVQRVDARSSGKGSQLVLGTDGAFESMAYQTR